MPLRRFEEVAESLDEEEKKSAKKVEVDPLDGRDLPRYLRRNDQPDSNLLRISLIATGLVFIIAVGLALVLRPLANPTIPAGKKIDRGLAVLATPRGFTATLYTPGAEGSRRVLSRKDGDPRDGEADGFVWFNNIPSRAVPAGNYLLELSAPGHEAKQIPVTIQAGRGIIEGYNTRTALAEGP